MDTIKSIATMETISTTVNAMLLYLYYSHLITMLSHHLYFSITWLSFYLQYYHYYNHYCSFIKTITSLFLIFPISFPYFHSLQSSFLLIWFAISTMITLDTLHLLQYSFVFTTCCLLLYFSCTSLFLLFPSAILLIHSWNLFPTLIYTTNLLSAYFLILFPNFYSLFIL